MGDLSELAMDIEIADDNVPPAVNTNENVPPVPPVPPVPQPASRTSLPVPSMPPPLPPTPQPASRTSLPVSPIIVALRNLKKKPGDANVIKGCINLLQNTLKHPDALPSTVWAISNDKEIEDNITSSVQLGDNVESITNLINTLQQRITPPGPSSSIPTANITPSVSRSSSSSSLRSHPYGNRPGKAEAKRIAKAKEEENDQYQFEICSLITTMSSSDVDIDEAKFPENLQYEACIQKLVECQELRDQLESLGIEPPSIFDSTPRNLYANFAYNYHTKLKKLIGKHSNAKKFSGVKRFGNS